MPFAFIFSPPSVFHSLNTNSFLLHHRTEDKSLYQTDPSHPSRGIVAFFPTPRHSIGLGHPREHYIAEE